MTIPNQISGLQLPATVERNTNKDVDSGYAGLTAGGLLETGELPSSVEQDRARIDLCGPGYTISPGQDLSAALQAAYNAMVTRGYGGDIVCSIPATLTNPYLLDGPQQTGTAYGYSYSGQVLFPATSSITHKIAAMLKGLAPANSSNDADTKPGGGLIIVSNASSGKMFDGVPGFTAFGAVWTGFYPLFEDVVLIGPDNPQCSGIDATVCFRLRAKGLTITTPNPYTTLTGGNGVTALKLPQAQNSGDIDLDVQITGWPDGIGISEHATGKAYVGSSKRGIVGYGGGHANTLSLDLEECVTLFAVDPSNTLILSGFLDWEDVESSGPFVQGPLVSEWAEGQVSGSLKMNAEGGPVGFPMGSVNGAGRGLDLENISQGGGGWKNRWPADNFKRNGPVTGAGPGSSTPTLTPWRVQNSGSFAVSGQRLTGLASSGGNFGFLPVPNGGCQSRAITAHVNLAPSGALYVYGHNAVSASGLSQGSGQANVGLQFWFGTAYLTVNNTTVVTIGSIAAGAHVMVLKLFYDGLGNPIFVKAHIDGVPRATYALNPTQQAALAPPPGSVWPYVEDGLALYDTTSYFDGTVSDPKGGFHVDPITDDPVLGITVTGITSAHTQMHCETTYVSSGSPTITLPPPVAGIPPQIIVNQGSGTVTVTPPSGTLTNLSGATGNITLSQGQSFKGSSLDGTNYVQGV